MIFLDPRPILRWCRCISLCESLGNGPYSMHWCAGTAATVPATLVHLVQHARNNPVDLGP